MSFAAAFALVQLAREQSATGLEPFGGSDVPFTPPKKPPAVTGGSGGAAEIDPLEAELEALRTKLATEAELELAAYEASQLTLESALERELITRAKYDEMILKAKEQHNARMAELDVEKYGTATQKASALFSQMATLMQSGNDKLFKIGKAAAIAGAIVDGFSAASAAWEKGMKAYGLPGAIAYTAASVAQTGALISSLKSTTPSGGGGGGGGASAGAGAAASVAAAAPTTSRNVAIQMTGGDMFSRDQVRTLINSINEAVEDGAIVRLV